MSNEPDEGAYANGSQLMQPQALQDELMALTKGSVEERLKKLRRKVRRDLVFVKGGTFMMGDLGPLWATSSYRSPLSLWDAADKGVVNVLESAFTLAIWVKADG
ncbi:hypothetical protein, partial [Paraburkholderia aspalathi]